MQILIKAGKYVVESDAKGQDAAGNNIAGRAVLGVFTTKAEAQAFVDANHTPAPSAVSMARDANEDLKSEDDLQIEGEEDAENNS